MPDVEDNVSKFCQWMVFAQLALALTLTLTPQGQA
jgi:hypothetical protein